MDFKRFRKLKKTYILIIGLLIVVAFIFIIFRNPFAEEGGSKLSQLRSKMLKNELVVHLMHSYHSLRKLPDILFFPYYFKNSQLPEYNLYINQDDIAYLNSNLSEDPFSGFLYNQNRVWANAIFVAGDYEEEVKVRYRGTMAGHWNSLQKSWRIKFPKEHLFQGMKTIDLIVPYDRYYFVEPLNVYRGGKLGLITLDMYFSRLNLNGQDSGVYLTFDRWTDDWLKKRRIPDDAGIFIGDDGRMPGDTSLDLETMVMQTERGDVYINKLTSSAREDSLLTLESILENTDDATFKRVIGNIFDLKKFYAWNVICILAGSNHGSGQYYYGGNTIIIFNPATGRFEFSPWDIEINLTPARGDGVPSDNRLEISKRIFSFSEFRQERNELLKAYIKDVNQFKDDLDFYDKLYERTKSDFYKDSAKLYNNFQFKRQVNFFREMVIDNFNRAGGILNYDSDYYIKEIEQDFKKDKESLELPGSFNHFLETGYSIDEFIAANPLFVKRSEKIVALSAGKHIFKQDVIIPANLQVIINPETTIYLNKDVSFLSYSPITAKGKKDNPIKVLPLDKENSWGTFAVVNTEQEESVLEYVEFDGGSGDLINGITFTGMVAFHNSDVLISNCIFRNAQDDDSLNIKYGDSEVKDSEFKDNLSDGMDIDFGSKETIIKNNKFFNNGRESGGDAIDLSWSDIIVENNVIDGCADKGISIGESSKPIIRNNIIEKCDIGIAVKDLSVAEITDNEIKHTRLGISAYKKKQVFGGGVANVSGIIFNDVITNFDKDDLSEINIIK